MSSPYVGEIRMFAGNFAPQGWAFCSGQLVPISENTTLFSLIGTTYGGDGQQTFQLPDLQGRVPIHQGNLSGGSTYVIGQMAGVEQVTLLPPQMPSHNHMELARTGNTVTDPTGHVLAGGMRLFVLGNPPLVVMGTTAGSVGGNQPHNNMGPYLCISFIISLFGVFPTQS